VASKARVRALNRRADFLALKASGRVVHVNSWLLLNWRPQEDGVRCGWTIPSHVGPAVLRNRLKRWGREFLRRWAGPAGGGLDMNVILKRKQDGFYRELTHREFDEAMDKAAAKLR